MKRYFLIALTMTLVVQTAPLTGIDAQSRLGRIYAKVTVTGGDEYEGRIIWGDQETIWGHTFDAEYDFYDHNRNAYWRQREYRDSRPGDLTAEFTAFFGDIKTIDRKGSRAILLLKDNREFEVYSEDASESIEVYDKGLGKIDIRWKDVYLIEFMEEPESFARNATENAYPLFGTVKTRSNDNFSGFIMWDNDESLSTHILDGEDRRNDREIPFSKIKSITPRTKRSSEIVLITGRELVLSGSNDVNDENRGIIIADPDYGKVSIPWKNVDAVVFEHNVPAKRYADYSAGRHLSGDVYDDIGKKHMGFIRWDDDECMTTDLLDGKTYDFDFKIRFENIKEIRRRTRQSAIVVLKNGRELRLTGSNDVNNENKGIVVLKNPDDEEGIFLTWDEFDRVVFK